MGKTELRLWKHATADGDAGDAYLYLEALVQESERARDDFEQLIRIYMEDSHSSVVLRANLALGYAPRPKLLLSRFMRAARRQRKQLMSNPWGIFTLLNRLLPGQAHKEAASGLEYETSHQEVTDKIASFNRSGLNNSNNGVLALQFALAVVSFKVMGGDLATSFRRPVHLRELVFGSEERTRSRESLKSHKLAQATRKIAGGMGYQNKNAKTRLEHARLAVRVVHKYHNSLEEALKGEEDNPYCPTSKSTLSEYIGPFHRSLGINLKRGPKPFEGNVPFTLPDRIRHITSSVTVWQRH